MAIEILAEEIKENRIPEKQETHIQAVERALSLPGRRNLICSPKKERAFLLLRSRGISSSRALWSALPEANSTKAAS